MEVQVRVRVGVRVKIGVTHAKHSTRLDFLGSEDLLQPPRLAARKDFGSQSVQR